MIIPLHSSPQRDSRRWGASSAVRWAAKKQTCCCCKLLMDSYHVHKRTYFLVLGLQFLSLRVWEFTQLVNMWLTRSYVMNTKRGHMKASVLSPSPTQPLPTTTHHHPKCSKSLICIAISRFRHIQGAEGFQLSGLRIKSLLFGDGVTMVTSMYSNLQFVLGSVLGLQSCTGQVTGKAGTISTVTGKSYWSVLVKRESWE